MTDPDVGMRRLRIDSELLSRLGPNSSRAEWERTLRRCGLLDLGAVGGSVGDQIREIQQLMRAWPTPRAEDPNLGLGEPRGWLREVGPGWALAFALAVTLGFTWSCAAGDLRGVLLTTALLFGVAWLRSALKQKLTPDVDPVRWAGRMTGRLRDLLSRSFVAAVGETVVENTPHLAWLDVREEQLEAAERSTQGRIAEIVATVEQIRATNERIGRPEEDHETARLRALVAQQEGALARIRALQETIRRSRETLLRRIESLRAAAERDALSERVARIAEGDPAVQRAVAEIDVDVVEVEAAFAALELDAKEADQRRDAVLEVVGITRALSRS